MHYYNSFDYRVIQQESSFEKLSELNNKQTTPFHPVLYHFRTSPTPSRGKKYALQLPFALLFDNLITVLWAVYGKNPKVVCGKSYNYRYIFYHRKINMILNTRLIIYYFIQFSKRFLYIIVDF